MSKQLRLYTVTILEPDPPLTRVIAVVAATGKADAIYRALKLWKDAGHPLARTVRHLLKAELHPVEKR